MDRIQKQDIHHIYSMYNVLGRRWMTDWNKRTTMNVPHTHFMALEILELEGPQRATVLANTLAITSGGVTVMTDKLVKNELVKRVMQEDDRRVVMLEITEKGRAVLFELQEQRTIMIDNLMKDLTEYEVQELLRIYKKLLDAHQD
ncbi:MarR family winged helix-turn-helix transcriptional regulator [Paenibacillus terrigena]|uniref:MarR family winged helix-turn-helix transcriptional regulator n=1 Tax=Paenibacillus terrigena TaxID=369333 RepID=UPI0028D652FB|nr:MarR family winged helix-turn-helix transcriptional regulator [Paenibacillus terrigena]